MNGFPVALLLSESCRGPNRRFPRGGPGLARGRASAGAAPQILAAGADRAWRPGARPCRRGPGVGFGVGGGVGVETGGFGGTAVGHGSRENQVGKGYFLVSDEVADLIFGYKWRRLSGGCKVAGEKLRAEVSELREARWEPMFGLLIMP